jgi:hypothetical protein
MILGVGSASYAMSAEKCAKTVSAHPGAGNLRRLVDGGLSQTRRPE